jgi:hypothetical protein
MKKPEMPSDQIPKRDILFFYYARRVLIHGIAPFRYATALVVVTDNFPWTGRERLICPSFLDHETKEKRFRGQS